MSLSLGKILQLTVYIEKVDDMQVEDINQLMSSATVCAVQEFCMYIKGHFSQL